MEITATSIGCRIKARRKELGLTQTDIKCKVGISSGHFSEIENGNRAPASITLYKLSQVLNCSIDWLITGENFNGDTALSLLEEEYLNSFRQLSPESKEEVLAIIRLKLEFQKRKAQGRAKSSSSEIESKIG